jgi:hypothetical protein
MAASKVKIGLMGTANIAGKNKRGIDLSGNAELYAVAAFAARVRSSPAAHTFRVVLPSSSMSTLERSPCAST